jgi:hypothetical protein
LGDARITGELLGGRQLAGLPAALQADLLGHRLEHVAPGPGQLALGLPGRLVAAAEGQSFVRAHGCQDRHMPCPFAEKSRQLGPGKATDSQIAFEVVEPKDARAGILRGSDRCGEAIGVFRFHADVPGQVQAHRLVRKAGLPRGGVTDHQHEAAGEQCRLQLGQPVALHEGRHLINPAVGRPYRGGWVDPEPDRIGRLHNPCEVNLRPGLRTALGWVGEVAAAALGDDGHDRATNGHQHGGPNAGVGAAGRRQHRCRGGGNRQQPPPPDSPPQHPQSSHRKSLRAGAGGFSMSSDVELHSTQDLTMLACLDKSDT